MDGAQVLGSVSPFVDNLSETSSTTERAPKPGEVAAVFFFLFEDLTALVCGVAGEDGVVARLDWVGAAAGEGAGEG